MIIVIEEGEEEGDDLEKWRSRKVGESASLPSVAHRRHQMHLVDAHPSPSSLFLRSHGDTEEKEIDSRAILPGHR